MPTESIYTSKFKEIFAKEFPGKPNPFNRQGRMKKQRDLYVIQLRATAGGILNQADRLEQSYLEDHDDLKTIQDIVACIDEMSGEMGQMTESVDELFEELKEYIETNFAESERHR